MHSPRGESCRRGEGREWEGRDTSPGSDLKSGRVASAYQKAAELIYTSKPRSGTG